LSRGCLRLVGDVAPTARQGNSTTTVTKITKTAFVVPV